MTEKELLDALLRNFCISSEGYFEWMWREGSGPHKHEAEFKEYYLTNKIVGY